MIQMYSVQRTSGKQHPKLYLQEYLIIELDVILENVGECYVR